MYALLTKDGETIIKKNAKSLDKAIKLFSEIKNLPEDKLLDIYVVKIVK